MSTNTWLIVYGMLSAYCLAGCLMEHFAVFSGWPVIGAERLRSVVAIQGAGSGFVYVIPKTLLTALVVVLLVVAPPGLAGWPIWAAFAALAVSWGSSAIIHLPLELRVQRGADVGAAVRLVRTDWIRVVTMALHFGFATVVIAETLAG